MWANTKQDINSAYIYTHFRYWLASKLSQASYILENWVSGYEENLKLKDMKFYYVWFQDEQFQLSHVRYTPTMRLSLLFNFLFIIVH